MTVRKPLMIVLGLASLAAFAAVGDLVSRRLGLAVPGSVLGLGAYVAALLLAPEAVHWTLPAARLLTGFLGALIVPAAVGLMLFLPLLADAALPLAILIVGSTLVTGIATALLMRLLGRRS